MLFMIKLEYSNIAMDNPLNFNGVFYIKQWNFIAFCVRVFKGDMRMSGTFSHEVGGPLMAATHQENHIYLMSDMT